MNDDSHDAMRATHLSRAAVLVALLTWPAICVRAQPTPASSAPPAPDAALPPAAADAALAEDVWQQPFEREEQGPRGPRSARHTDAHADRVIVAPTAETHPKGTLFLTAYEVVLPSIGYAFTDRMQAALTGLTDGDAAFFDFTLKANVLRSRWLRVATHASVDVIVPDDEEEDDDAIDLLLGRAGGTAQLCFELACRSSFSLSLTLVAHDAADTVLPIGVAAGFTARVSEVLVLLLEYSTLLNASRELPVIDLPFYLLSYGVRLTSDPSWSLDLALMRVLEGDTDLRTGELKVFDLLGVPLLVFTYRFL